MITTLAFLAASVSRSAYSATWRCFSAETGLAFTSAKFAVFRTVGDLDESPVSVPALAFDVPCLVSGFAAEDAFCRPRELWETADKGGTAGVFFA